MEHNEFYVYPGTYFTCGACGSSLSPWAYNDRPYRPKVVCMNPNCSKFRHVLVIGDEHRIVAFDTGELCPNPMIAMQNAQNARNNMATATTTEIPGTGA